MSGQQKVAGELYTECYASNFQTKKKIPRKTFTIYIAIHIFPDK